MFSHKNQILLIDDDIDILEAYQDLLEQEGYQVITCADPVNIVEQIPENWNGIILCDVLLPNISGLVLLEQFLTQDPQLPVIMITGHGDVPMAVDAVKKGATDFLEKPLTPEKLLDKVKEALFIRQRVVENRLRQLKILNEEFIGHSPWMKKLKQQLQRLADVDIPVFLWGEMGTGKHLAAKNLHQLNCHHSHLFYIKDCQSPDKIEVIKLIEQEFTGTLILSHIHCLSHNEQIQLVNSQQAEKRSFRLIILSEKPLSDLIQQKLIIPELYYLFSHTQIHMLALRDHPTDIGDIFKYYVQKSCKRLNKPEMPIKNQFISSLIKREWIGNIRELASAAELYVIGLYSTTTLLPTNSVNHKKDISLDEQVSLYEKQVIEDALNYYQGRINEAAQYLGIPRKKLYLRMRKYELDKKIYKEIV
ncbi:sigma-54-dependent transcriptional regulator [Zophobihabitans entericus]|uniref:Sigma-54-dependent Fis family transcriptional regulator n=1 Tax=Zophobihabitans entericus TaxID=1635327 RepID=A0A6G9IAE5_9GAMM|nr:sigma-54 dependent transcriptional regulator [Zophobihabitans entericus]QIQ20802.1 sigma-54-dependent Fis family transcriptional regulator [Zophobihabitans entericus]